MKCSLQGMKLFVKAHFYAEHSHHESMTLSHAIKA